MAPHLNAILADLDDDAPRLVWADEVGGAERKLRGGVALADLLIVELAGSVRDAPERAGWNAR